MESSIIVAPSVLASDFADVASGLDLINRAGAEWVHLDVMDGHFVPNLTIGPGVIKSLRPHSEKPFDVHLMITPVDPYIDAFAEAGADMITAHPEAGPHFHRTVQKIRSTGRKAGAALNPSTPGETLDYVLDELDLVLVMSVNPGFGGQSFIDSQLRKIEGLRQTIDRRGLPTLIEVDGGVNPDTAKACLAAGANALVAGSAVFRGGPGAYRDNIAALRS